MVKWPVLRALILAGLGTASACAQNGTAPIVIDYPVDGSVFPPDMAAPTFLWRDPAPLAVSWRIDVSFADGSAPIHAASKGERMRIGEIDPRCVAPTNRPPSLTPEQAAAHTWIPDPATWAAIKKNSVAGAATVTISGFASGNVRQPVSRGHMLLNTSADPVGAPIFYRDVPLMPSKLEKGVIKPLDSRAVPLIAWRLRDVAETQSRVLLEDMHSCANCHSFSGDGKTMGMDLDGPANDKSLYTLVSVQPKMTIRNEDVISWTSFRRELGNQLREGFMSQVSPDGRRVVTTIKPPGTAGTHFYYVANFEDYRFLQVFYPTRGILVWYDRDARKLQPLPGADDPRYVQTNAVWSPDGRYLVFARAEAKDPFPADGKMAAYANDPAEVPMQYDLYRIPFNDGKGGQPEPIAGASRNGMSNSFPKISPDGRWIVFVQARNGLLMRPDSQLYIVPAAGGHARRMRANTPLMNSWHSFSPNGRWLVFSSKSRSPYTQMFLTHIDSEGRDSPAILIENSTASNRAVNIPEFVNVPPAGIARIEVPAADFYRQFDVAADLTKKGEYAAAIAEWTKALAMNTGDARAYNNFGMSLAGTGRVEEAIAQYQHALALTPAYPEAHNNLGNALAGTGRLEDAIGQYRQALASDPASADAYNNLGTVLMQQGRLRDAIGQFEAALAIRADDAEAHNNLASALSAGNRLEEAIAECRKAIQINPAYTGAYNNLGAVLARQGKLYEAIVHFRKALELNPGGAQAEANLGSALLAQGKFDEAISHLESALAAGPETADLHNNLGMALGEKGRAGEAIPHFEKAVTLDPANWNAHANLGRAYSSGQRFDQAILQYEKALEQNPGSAELHSQLGYALANRNRVAEAIPHLERALEISPGLVDARYYLGAALMMNGQRAPALAEWRQALRQDPDNLRVLNDTAWVLATCADAAIRNGAEAVALAEHAAEITSGREASVLATLAAAYAETGRFDRAVELESRATDLAAREGNAVLAATLRSRLTLLQARSPIRQP
ncbi:Tetratricopeptide TPR_2 repeat protein (modular protein) [Candidatus Sulfopaludibacter sp. SbA4]|nr:Tetratricopeptide TPR_2 repeat protein (modular protein) [Candidatus Sulfopaludibacter sp. SbA4]